MLTVSGQIKMLIDTAVRRAFADGLADAGLDLPVLVKTKGKTTTAPASTPAPKPKPVAPRPSLYSGPDFDNVLGLGNYFVVK